MGRNGPNISHLLFADDILLFGEASVSQIRCVQKCLQKFCSLSGEKVSQAKTQIYFSKNMSNQTTFEIIEICGHSRTHNIGKYFGVQLRNGQFSRYKFADIISKVESMLQG